MDELTDRRTAPTRQLDVVVTDVDDFDAIARLEADVREAFASSGIDGKWTVALRPRHGVEGWIVGVVGCYDGSRVHADLKIEPAASLRPTMKDLFGSAVTSRPRQPGAASDREVA